MTGNIRRYMQDGLIMHFAKAFADYRGRSGNYESLIRSRAVDLFGPDTDADSAAKRVAFKRLARIYARGWQS